LICATKFRKRIEKRIIRRWFLLKRKNTHHTKPDLYYKILQE